MKIKTYAAVDIGSNAIRLLVNHIYDYGSENPIFNKTALVRLPVRLGQDSFTSGKISEQAIDKLVNSMNAIKLIMNLYSVDKYQVFGTSALRDSQNSQEVVSKVKQKTGITIAIIDGDKEANIILQTHLAKFQNPDIHYLYVDVGGGSTEISLLNNGQVLASRSFEAGTVRFLSGKVSDSFLTNEMKPFIKKITKDKKVELIGSGGNINFIFKLSGKREGVPVSYTAIKNYLEEFSKLSYEERMEKYNMKPDRADVIVPALNIFSSIMKWSKAKKIHIPKIGAADGMIQEMYRQERGKM